MIRDFWVKNYLSIRDKQEISFLTKGILKDSSLVVKYTLLLNKARPIIEQSNTKT